MRKLLIALAAAGGIGMFNMPASVAAPASGGAILGLIQNEPLVEQARLYCVNRYTGRFLYWGRCGGYRYHPRYYRRYHRHYYRHYYRY